MHYINYYRNRFTDVLLKKRKKYLSDIADNIYTIKSKQSKFQLKIFYDYENLEGIPKTFPNKYIDIKGWGDRCFHNVQRTLLGDIQINDSIIYKIENALVFRESIICKNVRHCIDDIHFKDYLQVSIQNTIQEAALAHNFFSARFWGHWLMSEFPMQLSLSAYAPLIGSSRRKQMRDEQYWRELAELPPIKKTDGWHAKSLFVCDPLVFEQENIKSWFTIRKKITKNKKANKKVYVTRGISGQKRSLKNEEELINKLIGFGFEILNVATENGNKILNTLSEAEIVIGVEGSHLLPIMYALKHGSTVVILQPPGRVSLSANMNSAICGICSAIYVCNMVEDYESFTLDVNDFFAFYDRVLEWTSINRDGIITTSLEFENRIIQ